ncbi:hypothetical protein [Agrobacterium tumefaciens]|uniref:hypothetical protein n=1 Tax=Agrobacterium tumefaciens TaxID=358 RepID=UPI0027D90B91|nr:hypothetical protein [Agrobacterium tumefaciens]
MPECDPHPPLLVTIWNQRKEALGALRDLCEAYAACNGEDHAAYVRARTALNTKGGQHAE